MALNRESDPAPDPSTPAERGRSPVAAGSKADQVYEWLRAEVAAGRLQPKDRVNADQISRDLSVSKIPVREAIARLTSEGALMVLANAGAMVAPLSWQELADIQATRLVIEPPMAGLAALDPSRSALAELRRNTADLRRWARTQEGDPFALIRRFHLALASMAGNQLMTSMVDLVLQRVSRYRVLARHTPASARSNAAEHAAIVEALAAGDTAGVQVLLAAHLRSEHSVVADARAVDARYFRDEPSSEQQPEK